MQTVKAGSVIVMPSVKLRKLIMRALINDNNVQCTILTFVQPRSSLGPFEPVMTAEYMQDPSRVIGVCAAVVGTVATVVRGVSTVVSTVRDTVRNVRGQWQRGVVGVVTGTTAGVLTTDEDPFAPGFQVGEVVQTSAEIQNLSTVASSTTNVT